MSVNRMSGKYKFYQFTAVFILQINVNNGLNEVSYKRDVPPKIRIEKISSINEE